MAKKSGENIPAPEEAAEKLPPGHAGSAHDPEGETQLWQALIEAAEKEPHAVREHGRLSERHHAGGDFKKVSEVHQATASKKPLPRRTPGHPSER